MLDTKKVHLMAKAKKTSKEIMKEFDIDSEEDFEKELRAAYTSQQSYGKITRLLDQNDKLRKKENKRKKTETEAETEAETETETKTETEIISGSELEIEPENPETLEEVLSQIDETNANISTWERKHQTAFSNRAQIRSRLNVKKNQLLKLEESVKLIEKEVENLRKEYNEEESHMKEFNALIASAKADLERLNSKRETLETLFILVYTDSIEINSEPIKQVNDSWEKVYEKLRNDERFDFLRVVEQKTLAKFLSLQWILPKERKQELCFDSSDMETAYELVKDQFKNP